MRCSKLFGSLAFAVTALTATTAQAVVITSLPRSPFTSPSDEWTESTFGDTTLDNDGTSVTLTTVNGQGEWFGWGQGYADPTPAWALGDGTTGNDLRFTARFSTDGRDWSSYLADGTYYADMEFKPTGCDYNQQACYNAPFSEGVQLSFADAFNSSGTSNRFVSLDMAIDHQFGYLMKGGLVSYLIDGTRYAGYAQRSSSRFLITGDASGSSPTGTGSMMLRAISIDTAPNTNIVLAVPEPASWAMMIGGFGMIGAAARRIRRAPAIA